jgi:hypothetical protein
MTEKDSSQDWAANPLWMHAALRERARRDAAHAIEFRPDLDKDAAVIAIIGLEYLHNLNALAGVGKVDGSKLTDEQKAVYLVEFTKMVLQHLR